MIIDSVNSNLIVNIIFWNSETTYLVLDKMGEPVGVVVKGITLEIRRL